MTQDPSLADRDGAEVGRGDTFGMISLFTGGIHTTTGLCLRDSEVVLMSRNSFKNVAKHNVRVMTRLIKVKKKFSPLFFSYLSYLSFLSFLDLI